MPPIRSRALKNSQLDSAYRAVKRLAAEAARRWPASLEGRVAVSAAVHVAVLAVISHHWWGHPRPQVPVGTAHDTQVTQMYLPRAASLSHETPKQKVARPLLSRTRPLTRLALPTLAAAKQATDDRHDGIVAAEATSGVAPSGSGTANLIYAKGFPEQKPDLSALPPGASGDVVVDLQIDTTGRVANTRIRVGMGQAIDNMILATVRDWVFYATTRDGRLVTSEQELHFHYGRAGNHGPCGWECFVLVETTTP